jgi:voltage-gated potassium channel
VPDRHSLHGRAGLAATRPAEPEEVRAFLRRMAMLGAVIVGVVVLGTIGFVVTEGRSVGFSIVWTVDTIATIGSIPTPSDTDGRIVQVLLIVLGVGTLFYALVTVTEFLVAGRLSGLLSERRTQRMIDSLTDHHLICGFGRVGRQVARDIRGARQPFVVIDSNPQSRGPAEEVGVPFLDGSPSEDEVLRKAGIERARTLIACMDSDAENIFTTLTARELRADLTIVARASVEDSEKKLKRAGADRVISPYKASGAEMARLALTPQVADVVDVAPEYRMEEIEVTAGCPADGRRIDDVRGSSIIVVLRSPAGEMQPMPPGDTVLAAEDVLVAMGTGAAMDELERRFTPAAVATTDGVGRA